MKNKMTENLHALDSSVDKLGGSITDLELRSTSKFDQKTTSIETENGLMTCVIGCRTVTFPVGNVLQLDYDSEDQNLRVTFNYQTKDGSYLDLYPLSSKHVDEIRKEWFNFLRQLSRLQSNLVR